MKRKHKTRNKIHPAPRPPQTPGAHCMWPGVSWACTSAPSRARAKSARLLRENFLRMPSCSPLVTAEQCGLGFLMGQSLIGNRKEEDKFGSGVVTIMRK